MIQISVSDIYDPNKMTVLSENERTVFCFYRKNQEQEGCSGKRKCCFCKWILVLLTLAIDRDYGMIKYQ